MKKRYLAIIFLLLIILLGVLIIYFAFSVKLGDTPLPAIDVDKHTKCGQVVSEKSLDNVVRCNETSYVVDNKNITLVEVVYGPPKSCPTGCLYNNYVAILDSGGIHDFNPAPNLFHIILDEYDEECARFNYYDNSKFFKRHIIKINEVYYWAYEFSNFNVEKNLGEYEDYYLKKLEEDPTFCVIDGMMIVTRIEGGYAKEADFSKLEVKLQK